MMGSRQQPHSWGTKREALDPLWNEHRNPACHWYVQVSRDQCRNIYICQCVQLLHDGMAETILSTEWLLCGDATYHPLGGIQVPPQDASLIAVQSKRSQVWWRQADRVRRHMGGATGNGEWYWCCLANTWASSLWSDIKRKGLCLPSVYQMSPHMTKIPRPSPFVLASCRWEWHGKRLLVTGFKPPILSTKRTTEAQVCSNKNSRVQIEFGVKAAGVKHISRVLRTAVYQE